MRSEKWKRFQGWVALVVVVAVALWLLGATLVFALTHPRATQTQLLLWTPWIVTMQGEGLEP